MVDRLDPFPISSPGTWVEALQTLQAIPTPSEGEEALMATIISLTGDTMTVHQIDTTAQGIADTIQASLEASLVWGLATRLTAWARRQR